jgi:AraC-like DNA-binding protein
MFADDWKAAAMTLLVLVQGACQTQDATYVLSRELPPCVRRALSFIDIHYRNPRLHLTHLADHLDITTWQVTRIFKRHLGEHFTDVVRRRRIRAAELMLLEPHCGVKEVGYAVGFLHASQFSRAFKRTNGVTPTDWRAHKVG